MIKTLKQLLGSDAPALQRYLAMALAYGVFSGLTIAMLAPLLRHLLVGDVAGAAPWLLALAAGMALCWAWRRALEKAGVRVGVGVLQGGRQRIGEHVARLPLGWFVPEHTARLAHTVTQGMMAVAQLPAHVLTPVITGLTAPLVMVAALFALHWTLGAVALAALPLLAGVFWLTARMGRRADAQFQRHFADSSARMAEFAQAQSVLRAFNGDGGGTRLLEEAIEAQHRAGGRLIVLSALSAVLNGWAVQAVFAALLLVCAWWLDAASVQGAQQVVAVVVALLLVNRFIEPLQEVAGYSDVLRSAHGQLDAAAAILAEPAMPEPLQPHAPASAHRGSAVELRQVRFAYAAGQREVLSGFSLQMAPGSMTALVGASGSGKSTVLRLIARFFDVSEGSVLVGGVDVRQMTSAQLAGQVSQIFQDSYLFQGSIADNIRLGKPDASDGEVLQAAQQAGVAEMLARLPQGLATPVGEGGARLSGGERQRIAIARALIKDAPVLLVDEATAALDAENQAAITQALMRLRGHRTVIVIAHQLSTVAMADQIVVLEDGAVCEQGTHAQLCARDGSYARMLAQRRQASGWQLGQPS